MQSRQSKHPDSWGLDTCGFTAHSTGTLFQKLCHGASHFFFVRGMGTNGDSSGKPDVVNSQVYMQLFLWGLSVKLSTYQQRTLLLIQK